MWHGFFQRHSKSAENSWLSSKNCSKNSCGSYSNTINRIFVKKTPGHLRSSKHLRGQSSNIPFMKWPLRISRPHSQLDGEVTTGSSARLCIIVIVDQKGLLFDDRPIGDKNALCRYISGLLRFQMIKDGLTHLAKPEVLHHLWLVASESMDQQNEPMDKYQQLSCPFGP